MGPITTSRSFEGKRAEDQRAPGATTSCRKQSCETEPAGGLGDLQECHTPTLA